ncbi:MAG: type I secretion system permease/ATPase [Tropicimonas sp.]|uniref:type I secretion system permease/ATPase n=1 Tax=Tropicimonas sp. TaxID=2067044 RepID=UPI003A8A5754
MKAIHSVKNGFSELRRARSQGRKLFLLVILFSIFVNLLMLTGPLFMLQVYDRVLASGHEETLVALFVLVAFLFLLMGILEVVRSQIMSRIAFRFQSTLDRRVFSAAMKLIAHNPNEVSALSAQRDLDTLRSFISSPVLIAVIDIPWTPIFVISIFAFHTYMGWMAIAGAGFLVALTLLNQSLTGRLRQEANISSVIADKFSEQIKSEAETVAALGMRDAAYGRWEEQRADMLDANLRASDHATLFSMISKVFRLFLQSAMLALGAWLVLQDELTPGAMIASSILLGRALAPIEMAIGQWPLAQQARQGYRRLGGLLESAPTQEALTPLPKPKARLEVVQLTVAPAGEHHPVLQNISFSLAAGQALGVIGPSASGKSSLAKAMIGAWPALAGVVRLDGAAITQYEPDVLGENIGYLPQRVALFNGTIAENIARLQREFDPEQVVLAAQRSGAHDMIVKLADGYNTRVTANGGRLSGGQIQRIGLARVLFGDPVLLILDEPNSNLDNEGSMAINAAIRDLKNDGKIVMLMAHRPAALNECDMLLVLYDGKLRAFGPRDEVLRETVKNNTAILRGAGPGGVA